MPEDNCHGWLPTNPRMVTQMKEVHNRLRIYHICLPHTTNTRWQLPWMVINYTKEGRPPSPGWLPNHPQDGHQHRRDGHPPSKIWSPTFKRWSTIFQIVVPNDPQDGHTSSPGGSPTIQRFLTNQPKEGQPPSAGWSNDMVEHHHLGGQQTTIESSDILSMMVN